MGVGLGEALTVEGGLPLAHHAKHLIVEDDGDDGQLVADSSAGFVEVHVEGAVAGEHDHPLAAAQRHLCADGCAVAEAHGAEAPLVMKPRLLVWRMYCAAHIWCWPTSVT